MDVENVYIDRVTFFRQFSLLNMDLICWSICSSSRREGDRVNGVNGRVGIKKTTWFKQKKQGRDGLKKKIYTNAYLSSYIFL